MEGIGQLTNANKYDDRDVDNLKGNEQVSTKTALNTLANKAGMSDDYAIHGFDKTAKELVAEHRAEQDERWAAAVIEVVVPPAEYGVAAYEAAKELAKGKLGDAIRDGGIKAGEKFFFEFFEKLGHGLGLHSASMAMILPKVLYALAKVSAESVAADGELGQERKAAFVKSAMHVMVLGGLNGLPPGYVDAAREHYLEDRDAGDIADKMSRALGRNGNNALMGVMQLHCDQGMGAARTMLETKQSASTFLRAHSDLAQRYADDPAFRAGFDGTVYAAAHGQYEQMMRALDSRDARYEAHHVAWRG
jgi:hypothetical protein